MHIAPPPYNVLGVSPTTKLVDTNMFPDHTVLNNVLVDSWHDHLCEVYKLDIP